MSRRGPVLFFLPIFALVAALLASVPATSSPPAPPKADKLDVYVVDVAGDQLDELLALGVDRRELQLSRISGEDGEKVGYRVETILSRTQAATLRSDGLEVHAKETGSPPARAADGVFRRYAGTGGLKEEFAQLAARNKRITKLVSIGRTVLGQSIIALKVSKNADKTRDGKKPAVVYVSAQHAREWITPEMTRRLAHHVVSKYGESRRITRLLTKHELWFVPVANPDGYNFTFTEGNRLWRKNLRDNNGDGEIAPGDGVDLNRNNGDHWGYDNEGSSPTPGSETYRGTGPLSEPESRALDRFVGRITPEFLVNYHSAAELLLYGVGWQVSTPSPDDVISEAMAGDDANPAVPGYDPDISAELYTTNGDTDSYLTERYGVLGFTPEMTTCEVASDSVPDDEWEAEDCESGFNFPDDEGLIQQEFRKNVPFALSVARSAGDPDDPVSVVGRNTPNFVIDRFEVSYGNPQPVSVIAKRALRDRQVKYAVNGGRTRSADLSAWRGGERYGDQNDRFYGEFRGTVRGTEAGDTVTVWFTGEKKRKGKKKKTRTVRSRSFTYTVASDSGADVLVIANEDYEGVNPTYPETVTAPKYADAHQQAIETAGYSSDVWDVDARGVPHHLGALSHYDGVVWYLGDNRLTQDPEDEEISTPFGELPDIAVAERQQYLTIAVRDYLNEGGKLVHAGETAQYSGLPGISDVVGGLYYGLNGAPEEECVIDDGAGFFEDCLIMADDFRQYYLGAFSRTDAVDPAGLTGVADPFAGFAGTFGGPVVAGDNPVDEAGTLQATSDVLPADEFPQFASEGVAEYVTDGQDPYAPVQGTRYAGALHQDDSYARLTKTVDLTGATAAELSFQLSLNAEQGYDHVIVEAHTVGQDDWTTLPTTPASELQTSTDVPSECDAGFFKDSHPFLETYLPGEDCTGGEWNSFTGDSDGWQDVAFDLSGFAGSQVEVSITYVTDPAVAGIGAFVDDTTVVVDGVPDPDGFEGPTSSWSPAAPPAGSADNARWQIGESLVQSFSAIAAADSVLFGFGFEQLDSDASRADLMKRALDDLL